MEEFKPTPADLEQVRQHEAEIIKTLVVRLEEAGYKVAYKVDKLGTRHYSYVDAKGKMHKFQDASSADAAEARATETIDQDFTIVPNNELIRKLHDNPDFLEELNNLVRATEDDKLIKN